MTLNKKNLIKEKVDQCWIIVIRIIKGYKSGIYGVIYKSPKQKKRNFLKIIDDLFEEVIDDRNYNFFTGDFNVDLSKKTDFGDKLLNFFNQHNLLQIIKENTRETNLSSTLIDYILTNDNEVHYDISAQDSISDHYAIKVNLKQYTNKTNILKNKKTKEFIKYSKFKLLNELDKVNFNNLQSLNVNEKALYMNECFTTIINNITVIKHINELESINEWYDIECVN
jgi:hypothetical protein